MENINENNYCVIMAGGIGSRFWPYSRQQKPKQFLDFFGTGRSLLQMTVDRFRPIVPIENMLIVTNVAYRDIILEQIPDMMPQQILCEPARRNTAPCIAYATAHIRSRMLRRGAGIKANIVVAASDHLILEEEKFRQTILQAFECVSKSENIVTLGMAPTRPETGYGYIQADSKKLIENSVYPVKCFKEKPDLNTAKEYIKSGDFLWNSGIFIWSLETISTALERYLPEIAALFKEGEIIMGTAAEKEWIEKNFPQCENISIDYGVMEKADKVRVIPSSFGWSDLGTWGSLYELSNKDTDGNVGLHAKTLFYDAHDNIVTLEPGKLAVIQGVDDMIVAEQEGVLLICKKQEEQSIKQMVADVEEKFQGRYN